MSATEGHRGLDLRLWLYVHWGEVASRARRTSRTVRGSSIQRANGPRTTIHSPFHEERRDAVTSEFALTADDTAFLSTRLQAGSASSASSWRSWCLLEKALMCILKNKERNKKNSACLDSRRHQPSATATVSPPDAVARADTVMAKVQ